MPFPLIPIVASILTPLATRLIKAYIEPKILPVMKKVNEIEVTSSSFILTTGFTNDEKHNIIFSYIHKSPEIMRFVDKCGWNSLQLDVVIKFCVLMVKKPITSKVHKERWNDHDMKVVFDFLGIILAKWVNVMRGKK